MKGKRVLIIGRHPLAGNVVAQYEAMGASVDHVDDCGDVTHVSEYDELGVFPACGETPTETDSTMLSAMRQLAADYQMKSGANRKPLCHMLLHSKVTLWLMQTLDLYKGINDKFEVYAFTMADLWAKNVLCEVGTSTPHYKPLDREPVTTDMEKTVHFVIFGMGDMAESLAQHAALVAHFPNYVRNHSLRTRITIVGKGITARRNAFLQRHQELFDHSYYRCMTLDKSFSTTLFHYPVYVSSREDFIDVEWEFVEGELHHPVMQAKLRQWAQSKSQILTLALCYDSFALNFDEAFTMPKEVYENDIPVLTYVRNSEIFNDVRATNAFTNIYPFGMENCGYDVRLPLLRMAKCLNYFYQSSYGGEGTPTDMPAEKVEEAWAKLKNFSFRYSNIYNVMTIATKMRSLGHKEKEWDVFYALNKEEIEQLSAVEHNRWSLERLMLGFRPPSDSERKEIEDNIKAFERARKDNTPQPEVDLKKEYKKKKVHFDLCSYNELGNDATGKDVRIYDYDLTACIPLIANTFKEQQT